MDLDALGRWQTLRHWSDVDPGPLTDDEKHRRVVRLHAELEAEAVWLAKVTADSRQTSALLERAIARTLALPAANPERKP